VGLAASLLMMVGVLSFNSAAPKVSAAEILNQLTRQIESDELIEVRIESLAVEGVLVNVDLQIAIGGVAGDVRVIVDREDVEQRVEVDISLGISMDGGWVLLRHLDISDPKIGAIFLAHVPADTETLLLLPEDTVREAVQGLSDADVNELRSAASGEVVPLIKALISAEGETGVTVTERRDGMVELNLELSDPETLRKLIRFGAQVYGEEIDEQDADFELDELEMVLGSKLSIVYDPDEELVRSLSITDIGELKGSVMIELKSGDLDPALLDAGRVTKPGTRTFDLTDLMSFAEALGSGSHHGSAGDDDDDENGSKKRRHR